MKWVSHRMRPDLIGKEVGTIDNNGYVKVWIDMKQYRVHRLAFLYMDGVTPLIVDHINGNPSDNRWANLRNVNKTINGQNIKKARRDSSHGFLGVHKGGAGFTATICVNGKSMYLGSYATPEIAHEAYLKAKRKLHEGNTL